MLAYAIRRLGLSVLILIVVMTLLLIILQFIP